MPNELLEKILREGKLIFSTRGIVVSSDDKKVIINIYGEREGDKGEYKKIGVHSSIFSRRSVLPIYIAENAGVNRIGDHVQTDIYHLGEYRILKATKFESEDLPDEDFNESVEQLVKDWPEDV